MLPNSFTLPYSLKWYQYLFPSLYQTLLSYDPIPIPTLDFTMQCRCQTQLQPPICDLSLYSPSPVAFFLLLSYDSHSSYSVTAVSTYGRFVLRQLFRECLGRLHQRFLLVSFPHDSATLPQLMGRFALQRRLLLERLGVLSRLCNAASGINPFLVEGQLEGLM